MKKNLKNVKEGASNMELLHANAAGIDIGAKEIFVCVPKNRDNDNIRKFGTFTEDYRKVVDWLKKCKVDTVAMESTGVYWIPLFEILESNNFKVFLVNASHIKNVPGKKTDVADCQWIQRLHSYGLLSASFRPTQNICKLRSYMRQREILTGTSSTHIQRMQKVLTEMNVKLHEVISDISGETGLKIIEAILEGERDTLKLSALRGDRIRSSQETIRKSLDGNYRDDLIFLLKQEYDLFCTFQGKIVECDQQIRSWIKNNTPCNNDDSNDDDIDFEQKVDQPSVKKEKKFNLNDLLQNLIGVDITSINGLGSLSAIKIISEVGTDMTKWPTEKHFASWLGLCPNNKITGGRIKSSKTKKGSSRAAQVFRMAAYTLLRSHSALGAFCRRIKMKHGTPKAITATAHKIAKTFYRLIKYGKDYVDLGANYYEKKYEERIINNIKKKALKLGLEIVQKVNPQGEPNLAVS